MCLVTFSWEKPDSVKKVEKFELTQKVTWAHLELTDVCNLRCEWCYAGVEHGNKAFMSLDGIEKALIILARSGVKQVTYAGGEPLIHPNIKEAVALAHNLGMVVHINSNGTFLTPELAVELKKCGLSQIQINLIALDEDLPKKILNGENASEKVINALKNAKAADLITVAQTVLTTENEDSILEIIRYFRENFKIDRVRVWDTTPSGAAIGKRELYPLNYPKTLEKITEYTASLGATHVLSYEPFFPLQYESPIAVTHVPCPSGEAMLIHVFVDFKVYFCCTMRGAYLYDLFDYENISELHKEKVMEYKTKFYGDSACNSCKFSGSCEKGCPTRASIEPNRIDYQCPTPVTATKEASLIQ
ncbi:MAG TPA: radical SAM protein [Flavobacteriales bacterium]|nr:radical SAM protein [Flavobacteriales bacterium]